MTPDDTNMRPSEPAPVVPAEDPGLPSLAEPAPVTPEMVKGARVSTGLFMAALTDGSVADLTDDEAFELTASAASVPEVAGKAFGLEPGVADQYGSDRVQETMLSEFYSAGFLRDFAAAEQDAAETVASMKEARERAVFEYAGMSEEDVARARQDAEAGDMSAFIAAKERFYLG